MSQHDQQGFDSRRFKALERSGFNRIAARYADGAPLRDSLQRVLLEHAALQPGEQVLDLAAGPGVLARAAARQVLPDGWVLASDIAEVMLAEGQRRARAEGLPDLLAAACDAEHLSFGDARFDVVLIGLGLFILPDPARALSEIHRVLRPGGRIALSVWGPRDRVPLISRAQDCIARVLPAPKIPRPSVYRLGEDGLLTSLLQEAGFRDVQLQPHTFTCRFDTPEAYWQAFLDLAGGAAESLSRLPEDTRQLLREAVASDLANHRSPQGDYPVEGHVLIALGRS